MTEEGPGKNQDLFVSRMAGVFLAPVVFVTSVVILEAIFNLSHFVSVSASMALAVVAANTLSRKISNDDMRAHLPSLSGNEQFKIFIRTLVIGVVLVLLLIGGCYIYLRITI
jgi:hypothetical protein